jgi:hypothetical protein
VYFNTSQIPIDQATAITRTGTMSDIDHLLQLSMRLDRSRGQSTPEPRGDTIVIDRDRTDPPVDATGR